MKTVSFIFREQSVVNSRWAINRTMAGFYMGKEKIGSIGFYEFLKIKDRAYCKSNHLLRYQHGSMECLSAWQIDKYNEELALILILEKDFGYVDISKMPWQQSIWLSLSAQLEVAPSHFCSKEHGFQS